MAINVGDKVPAGALGHKTADGISPVSTEELFSGKKVVLFSVPGAFTPTCSAKHLPGFVQQADAIKAKGVDTIACMAVNGAKNAALYAGAILALKHDSVREKLQAFRDEQSKA